MNTLYKAALALAALCGLVALVLLVFGVETGAGPAVVGLFVALAIGVRGLPVARDFAFTVWIFAAVAAAMFYPAAFTSVGDFETKVLIVPLIQVIMFGMGTALSLGDFWGVVKMPKGVLVGLVCQFTIMPFVGLGLAMAFGFPPEIAAGVVLIGSAPSGVASNVMAFIAKANLPLSVTLTAVSTLMAPIMTPFLMQTLAGQFVPIDFVDMMLSIINMVIVPIALGLLFNKLLHGRAAWLDRAMPVVSMVGIAVIITIITALGRDDLLAIGVTLVLAAIIHNFAGYFFGYWGCRLARMDEESCRTIAIEVGMQNGGLASGIAVEMGKVATVGLAPAVFGPWMNISGSALANYWRRTSGEPARTSEPEATPAT
ncbi:MAG: bile acid:sodium symporter family protein [Rhodothermales bacterium]